MIATFSPISQHNFKVVYGLQSFHESNLKNNLRLSTLFKFRVGVYIILMYVVCIEFTYLLLHYIPSSLFEIS